MTTISTLFGAECTPKARVGPAGSCTGLLSGLIWPVPVDRDILITAFFRAWFYPEHNAIDITYKDVGILPPGTPVLAAMDGVVAVASSDANDRCGIYVVLYHKYRTPAGVDVELYTGYCHLSSLAVRVGDSVKRGQTIGYSGNTGHSTGPHLHFYINMKSPSGSFTPIDPCTVLPDIPGKIFWYNPTNGNMLPGCSPNVRLEPCAPGTGSPSPADQAGIVSLICEMFLRVNPDRSAANLAIAVAAAESGLNPRAVNVNQGPTGCSCTYDCRNEDWGLFQINLACHVDNLKRRGIIQKAEDLFDPATNIAAAILISNGGRYWTPWAAYNNGSYLRFLNKPGYTCP